ncbi:MAG: adenylate/guanylate cyclase domain-containing protein [Chloroflexota bacterium]|nr:adenylate/guanylate cyclase domain-containing protein [Chloroflexota bacterium]
MDMKTQALSPANMGRRATDELRLDGEWREVTILFADIRGFTTLAECLPPEELVTVLNTYLSSIARAFRLHGGMINKFGGDSIMVVWNAPAACEEHAAMATIAAFEAQRAIRDLQRREFTLPRVDFGIGINTGRVLAGNMGCDNYVEYSVIGDAVNTAARLTAAVPGGKVWITAGTFEQAKDHVSVKSLEPLVMKGKRHPVKAYEVTDIPANLSDWQSRSRESLPLRADRVPSYMEPV